MRYYFTGVRYSWAGRPDVKGHLSEGTAEGYNGPVKASGQGTADASTEET